MADLDWDVIFSNINSSDQDKITEALIQVQHEIQNNFLNIIQICMRFFLDINSSIQVKIITIIIISKCFTYNSKIEIDKIRRIWLNDTYLGLRSSLKQIVINGIVHENFKIRNNFCHLYALLISIENSSEDLNLILENLKSPQSSPFLINSFAIVFYEIFQLPNFSELLSQFSDSFTSYLFELIQILSRPILVSPEFLQLYESIVKAINCGIPEMSKIFGESSKIILSNVMYLMNNLSHLFPYADSHFYNLLHDLIGTIFKTFYSKLEEEDFDTFLRTFITFLENSFHIPKEEFLTAPLILLQDITEYENSLLYSNKVKFFECESEYGPSIESVHFFPFHSAIEKICNSILPSIYFLMSHFGDDEWDIENPEDMTVSMYANYCFESLFSCAPETVFSFVNHFWKNSIENPDLKIRHAAIMSISSLLEIPLFDCKEIKKYKSLEKGLNDRIFDFVSENVWNSLFPAISSKVKRITESSLYIMQKILSSFPKIINTHIHSNSLMLVQNLIRFLRSIYEGKLNIDTPILNRIFEVFRSIASAFSVDDPSSPFLDVFSDYCDAIDEMEKIVIRTARSRDDPRMLLSIISELYNTFFINLPALPETNQLLLNVCQKLLKELKSNLHIENEENQLLIFAIQRKLVSNIGTIIQYFLRQTEGIQSFDQEIAKNTLSICIETMTVAKVETVQIWEESLLTISLLVNILKESIPPNVIQILFFHITKGFQSKNAQIIEQAFKLLNTLFDQKNHPLDLLFGNNNPFFTDKKQLLENFFKHSSEIWVSITRLMAEGGPIFLDAQSLALKTMASIAFTEYSLRCPEELLTSHINQLRTILQEIKSQLHIDQNDLDQCDRCAILGASIAYCYTIIAETYVQKVHLKRRWAFQKADEKKFVTEAVDWVQIMVLNRIYSIEYLQNLCKLLITLSKYISSSNNTILSRSFKQLTYLEAVSMINQNYENVKLIQRCRKIILSS